MVTASHFPDLDFLPAALVLARVVSRPGDRRLCLDLGHKAVRLREPAPARFISSTPPSARAVAHNEEHLVVEIDSAAEWPKWAPVGTAFRGTSVPRWLCTRRRW